MMRRIVALGLLGGSLMCTQPANAQGLWIGGPGFGGIGFGSPGFGGFGYSPYGFGNVGLYGRGIGSGYSPYGFGNAAFFGGYAPAVLVHRELESRGQDIREHGAAPCRVSRGLRPRRFIA